jgi:hypothetical protein
MEIIAQIRDAGMKVGMAIKPGTEVGLSMECFFPQQTSQFTHFLSQASRSIEVCLSG